MYITIDIETVPTTNQAYIDELAKNIKPPANYKKQDTIDKWMDENRDAELDSLVRKTALDLVLAEIVSIGYAINDEPAEALIRKAGTTEYELLAEFKAVLSENVTRWSDVNRKFVTIGFNHVSFDLPLLHNRAAVYGIALPLPKQAKPWDRDVFDVMAALGGTNYNRVSLHRACLAFGLPSKQDDEMDGSKVYDEWLRGQYERIQKYCALDVYRTRELYYRLTGAV